MTPAALFAGIRDGNAHAGGIRCLRLLRVEPAAFATLAAEIMRLCGDERASDASASDHVTSWTRPRGEVRQYSLLNASGRFEDFGGDHDHSCRGKRFHHAERYPALARFVAEFPHAINFRLNVLGPRARLAAHEERSIFRSRGGTAGVCARFHLPVVTDPGAELILDGSVHHLEAGIVHFVNHGCVHAARNRGAARRVHLVWDLLLTREVFAAVFGDGPPPPGMVRVPEAAWPAPSLGVERMGAYVRLPDLVSPDEADRLGWCEPQ